MSKDGYLPPGVEDSDLPGNRPEDAEWEQMVEALWEQANDLCASAENLLEQSEHFAVGDLKDLVKDAMGAVL